MFIKSNQVFLVIIRIFIKGSVKCDSIMCHTNFQNQQKDSNINPIIKAHLIRWHDSPLTGLLIAKNPEFPFTAFHNPWLGIAGTGGKPDNVCNLQIVIS